MDHRLDPGPSALALERAFAWSQPAAKALASTASQYASVLLRRFPDPSTEQSWQRFLTRVDYPAHYDSPAFFLEPYWKGQKPFAVLLFEGDEVVASVTGLDQGAQVTCGLTSRPQIAFARDSDRHGVSRALADALAMYFPDSKLTTLYAWGATPLPGFAEAGFRTRELEGDAVLDLRPGAEVLLERLPKNRRRDIRLAVRNGIEVREATTDEDAQAYWSVYSAWRATTRKEIHHNRDFSMLAQVQKLRGNHRRFLARYKGEVIAASGIRFYPGGLVEYANNCSRDEFLHLLPNDLLVWKMIEWAATNGFPKLSMGGNHPFLAKWADRVERIRRYRLDRSFLQRVELKEQLNSRVRQLARGLPTSLQSRLKTLFRKRAA